MGLVGNEVEHRTTRRHDGVVGLNAVETLLLEVLIGDAPLGKRGCVRRNAYFFHVFLREADERFAAGTVGFHDIRVGHIVEHGFLRRFPGRVSTHGIEAPLFQEQGVHFQGRLAFEHRLDDAVGIPDEHFRIDEAEMPVVFPFALAGQNDVGIARRRGHVQVHGQDELHCPMGLDGLVGVGYLVGLVAVMQLDHGLDVDVFHAMHEVMMLA